MQEINISYFAVPGIAIRKLYKADRIIKLTCEYFDTSIDKVRSKPRNMDLVLPRHVAMYLIRKHTPYSLLNIGKIFYRDHTTVINAVRQIENYFDTKNYHVIQAIEKINLKILAESNLNN